MRTLGLSLAAALAFAATAHGAPVKPQITDPAGDAVPPVSAGYDVVSALFATQGSTARVGRKLVYTPSKLVVTVTYNGDVPADQHLAQVVAFDLPGCENVYLERYAAGTTYGTADCTADSFDFATKVSGKTLTMTVPFATIGKAYLKPGASLTNLRTYTAFADPAVGYETAEFAGLLGAGGTIDDATTTAPYKVT